VEVGEWLGNSWFINEGLHAGESVVVDGGQTLTPGQAVVIKGTVANDQPAPPAAPPNPEDKKPEAAKGIDQNGRS
jgi:membrane fusion protein (multidrug efflux system)